jgi:hypothetical protein
MRVPLKSQSVVKKIGIILAFLGFIAAIGCEKDIREPGEPRIAATLSPPR